MHTWTRRQMTVAFFLPLLSTVLPEKTNGVHCRF